MGTPPASTKTQCIIYIWNLHYDLNHLCNFLGIPYLQENTFFIRITTILEASYLYLFACLRKPTCARLYNFFVLVVIFHLIGTAQLFRLSKQFQILVLGSILLVILPSCVIHKSESVSSSKKLTKCWWSPVKHRDLWCISEISHLK